MPSNLNNFGTVNATVISSNVIDSVPTYLKQFNEDSSAQIAEWQLNSKVSQADALIFAIGNGTELVSSTVSNTIDIFSAYILGKYTYENHWQINYLQNENICYTYYDGNNYFKRFTIDYKTGNLGGRSITLRNGNIPNCNADFQAAFGYSNEASYADYSQYRHNIRTSHSNDINFNYENALDLYIWDKTNDLPDDIGSRHVVRWNALGNEELVSGFRIDGGLNVDISTPDSRALEQTNYAVTNKGVIYFNTSVNKYRYSENGGAFKYLGSGSGGGSGIIQSCDLNQCGPYSELLVDKPIAIMMHSVGDLSINKISIATMVGSTDGINIGLAIYKPSVNTNTLSGITLTKTWSGTVTTTVNEEMLIATIGDNDVVTVNGWYSILITNMNANNNPVIAAYVNQTQMLDDTSSVAYQLDASSAISNGTWVSTFTPNKILNTEIVPYIKIGGASDSDSQSSDTYKVKLTSSDNTEDYIENKLSAGTNVTIDEVTENGIKKLKINSTASGSGGGTSAANNKIAVLANPCADDDIILFYATEAVNINSMILLMRSTDETITQSISVSIYKVNARNAISSATAIVSGTVSDFATGTTLSVNSALITGNMLILKVTTVVGSPILLETITTFGSSLT
ncbi:MAG: hypothetical protein M0R17_04265 [Candidatus Omnitrophica bacterium]|jgi:hypothetical protein|nr:hypothetical protein [Candidatus Omnitrophota bacterium]